MLARTLPRAVPRTTPTPFRVGNYWDPGQLPRAVNTSKLLPNTAAGQRQLGALCLRHVGVSTPREATSYRKVPAPHDFVGDSQRSATPSVASPGRREGSSSCHPSCRRCPGPHRAADSDTHSMGVPTLLRGVGTPGSGGERPRPGSHLRHRRGGDSRASRSAWSPAACAPLLELRALGAEGGVAAVAGVDPGGVVVHVEDPVGDVGDEALEALTRVLRVPDATGEEGVTGEEVGVPLGSA